MISTRKPESMNNVSDFISTFLAAIPDKVVKVEMEVKQNSDTTRGCVTRSKGEKKVQR
jgi:hypothetical protein